MSSGADLKCVLLGQKNVGKTSVFNRYVYQEFGPTSMTIGAYFALKTCRLASGQGCSLAIWDTAGEERFDSLTTFYCRDAQAAVVCYDITSLASFQRIERWLDKISNEAQPDCVIVFVGNKLDIVEETPAKRQVQFADAEALASQHSAKAFEVSAKTGKGVADVFDSIVRQALDRNMIEHRHQHVPDRPVNLTQHPPTSSRCC